MPKRGDPEPRKGRVIGIGGVFFRAKRREDLAAWYHDALDLPVTDTASAKLGDTVWAAFDAHTQYFGPNRQAYMINYRVDDLPAALQRLREVGATVSPDVQEDEYGSFAWAEDPEGNRFELWQATEGM